MRRQLKTIEDYLRAIRFGYGLGEGVHYTPWIGVRDVPSTGRGIVIHGLTIGREHEFLSDTESSPFYVFDYLNHVVDIREQFPLLPLDVVTGLAERYDLPYPHAPRSSDPAVLTEDYLLTLVLDGRTSYLAIACKQSADLQKVDVLRKLEIQRLFWSAIGIPWRMITEKSHDLTVSKNLAYISHSLRASSLPAPDFSKYSFHPDDIAPQTYCIDALVDVVADRSGLNTDDAELVLHQLIWNDRLRVDLSTSIQRTGLINVVRFDPYRTTRSAGGVNAGVA